MSVGLARTSPTFQRATCTRRGSTHSSTSRRCSTAHCPSRSRQPFLVRMFYSSYFYLSLASGLGAFVAWLIVEPFIDDDERRQEFEVGGACWCFPR